MPNNVPDSVRGGDEYHFTRRQVETALLMYLKGIHGIPMRCVESVRLVPLDGAEDVAAAVDLAKGVKMPGAGSTGVRRKCGFINGAGI